MAEKKKVSVTSSRDRSTRQRTKPVTNSARRPSRQRNPTASVTNSESRPTGGNARVTRNQDARRPPSGAGRVDNTNVGPKNTGRSLPGAGGTNAGSPRAQNQQAWTRDRGARTQLQRGMTNLARGAARMAGVDRVSQAGRKADAAAQGTKGEGVREGRPRPEITRSQRGGTQSTRIEPVNVRDVTASRRQLPPGQPGGGLAARDQGGEVARRQRPYPRPGGSVVVDESPRLPEGRRGGDLARTGGSEGGGRSGRTARLPADSRGGTRIGNSSQPWGDRPSRTNSPRISSTRALPPGKPGGPLVSGGARPKGGSGDGAAAQAGGQSRADAAGARAVRMANNARRLGLGRLNMATLGLGAIQAGLAATNTGWGQAVRRSMAEDNDTRQRLIDFGTSGGKGGFKKGGKPKGGLNGPGIPDRLSRQGQETRDQRIERYRSVGNAEAPSRPSRGSGGQSGGYTPASRQSPAPAAPSRQSERPTRTSGPEPGTREWKNFNPGRGTSYTNNPLLRNDEYLMGKIKQREDSLPKGPVADGASYGESLKIEKLRQEEENKKKKK